MVVGADNSLYVRLLKPINKIVSSEQMCGGDCNCANLDKTDYGVPELIIALKDKHYLVTFLYAHCRKHICSLSRQPRELRIGEKLFISRKIDPHKRPSVRLKLSEFINYIVTEIVVIGTIYLKFIQYSVFIESLRNEMLIIIFYFFH